MQFNMLIIRKLYVFFNNDFHKDQLLICWITFLSKNKIDQSGSILETITIKLMHTQANELQCNLLHVRYCFRGYF